MASDVLLRPSIPRTGAHPIAKADLIEGMAKGMAVLEAFDTQRQRLNATLAAQRAGITVDQVRALIAATIPVTPSVAAAIAHAFGTDTELWLSLERSFGRWKSSIARGGEMRAA